MVKFFTPPIEVLDKYAKVLVNFALNNGKGIRKGEVVFLQVPESAKPLLLSLHRQVLISGGNPIVQYLPDEMEKEFFTHASDDQLKFFPTAFLRGKIKQADHFLTILAETDLHELEGIDPLRIMEKRKTMKPYLDWRNKKEDQKKFSWTLALFPTPAMAAEAGLSLKQCWQQVISACFLTENNPVSKWQQVETKISEIKSKLNHLKIEKLHLEADETDLWIGLDSHRRWLSGSGANIPSFEIFISPDWRRTNGTVAFNLPLYYQGNITRDIKLEFKDGIVIRSSASHGEKVLKSMIAVANADKVGEFSLTDKRFSKITRFMAETLYDENFGGKFGNTHLALGASFHESYPKKSSKISPFRWKEMGFNDSVIHTDIIATTPRVVTAHFQDGTTKIIYRNGQFIL